MGKEKSKVSSFANVHAGVGLFCLHIGTVDTNLLNIKIVKMFCLNKLYNS